MQYLLMALFVGAIVAADQLSKLWVVGNIPLHTQLDAIPGLFSLTYVQNTGAAFSSFQGMRWLFALIFVLFTAAVIWEFSKKRMPFTTFDRWCIIGYTFSKKKCKKLKKLTSSPCPVIFPYASYKILQNS